MARSARREGAPGSQALNEEAADEQRHPDREEAGGAGERGELGEVEEEQLGERQAEQAEAGVAELLV